MQNIDERKESFPGVVDSTFQRIENSNQVSQSGLEESNMNAGQPILKKSKTVSIEQFKNLEAQHQNLK